MSHVDGSDPDASQALALMEVPTQRKRTFHVVAVLNVVDGPNATPLLYDPATNLEKARLLVNSPIVIAYQLLASPTRATRPPMSLLFARLIETTCSVSALVPDPQRVTGYAPELLATAPLLLLMLNVEVPRNTDHVLVPSDAVPQPL